MLYYFKLKIKMDAQFSLENVIMFWTTWVCKYTFSMLSFLNLYTDYVTSTENSSYELKYIVSKKCTPNLKT